MDVIIGIDLGTTNSEVAVVQEGQPVMLSENGDPILPSVVGLDPGGKLLVGRAARNLFVLAPERTVRSIKRKMGEDVLVPLGNERYRPQEISAMILRTLKTRAERALGHAVSKAVITVPAFFTEGQREATRQAGELAGLEVVRIINEPTAAVLTYDPHPPEMERLLVYDLGGGTFDVSIAMVEAGVVEILSSHGDTHLGGDDFDQLLLDFVCDRFQTEHGIDLRESLVARSRLLAAVEEAKKQLSTQPVAAISEEFIAENNSTPLNLQLEVLREDFENLIEPLLGKTLKCVDDALGDAGLQAPQIHKVLLVGGATRTPLVHRLLETRLGRPVHAEVEPDLAVALGAAVQGGLIAGVDVGPVLVDITPHTLGIETLGERDGAPSRHNFSPIVERNTPLPASRTEIYNTVYDGQEAAEIKIFQGEDQDTRYCTQVGAFTIKGLADVPAPNELLVRLDLDLNGILRVTATERTTGLAKQVVIENMMERFRVRERANAVERLNELFATSFDAGALDEFAIEVGEEAPELPRPSEEILDVELTAALAKADGLIARAGPAERKAAKEDAAELKGFVRDLQAALATRSLEQIRRVSGELEDLLFYLSDQ
jgi:molecular chaperone DnaK